MRTNKVIRGYFPEFDTPPELLEVAKHSKSYEAGAKLVITPNKSRQNNQTGDTEMSHVTRDEFHELKLDIEKSRGEIRSEMASMSAKLDNIPTQLELVRSNVKNDTHEMMKSENRFLITVLLTAAPLITGAVVWLVQNVPAK